MTSPKPDWSPVAHCEVIVDYRSKANARPCLESVHTVVPLPGGAGIFVCAVHARHLTPTGEIQ